MEAQRAGEIEHLRVLDVGQRSGVPKPTFLETGFSSDGKRIFAFFAINDGTNNGDSLAVEKWDVVVDGGCPSRWNP